MTKTYRKPLSKNGESRVDLHSKFFFFFIPTRFGFLLRYTFLVLEFLVFSGLPFSGLFIPKRKNYICSITHLKFI